MHVASNCILISHDRLPRLEQVSFQIIHLPRNKHVHWCIHLHIMYSIHMGRRKKCFVLTFMHVLHLNDLVYARLVSIDQ